MKAPKPEILAHARDIVSACDRCADPVASAQVLPGEAYVSEEFWQFEKWAIFARDWLFVGHVGQVPRPGDYLARRLLDEPILIVRDERGTVRVLSGVCQHRGHPLVGGLKAQPEGAPCDNARRLVCPYHAWSYRLDGTLDFAAEMERTTPVETLRREIRLPELRSEIFHGLIFVTFAADAPPLAPSLARLDREIAAYGLAEMVPMPVRVDKDLAWNWKVHHENALEPYHTDYVHKRSHGAAPANLSAFMPFAPGDGQIMTTTDFAAGNDLFAGERPAAMPVIATLAEAQRRRLLFVSVMPCFFAVFQPSAVMLTLILPRGPGLLDTHRFPLYPRSTVEAPGFRELYEGQIARQGLIIEEDRITQTAVQAAHHSRFTPRGRLSWLEATIPQMNQWLLERYRRALADGGRRTADDRSAVSARA